MRTVYSAIFHNLFLKIISLALAILTWTYIIGELYKQVPAIHRGPATVINIADQNVIVKTLPVHVNLLGAPDEAYEMVLDRIKITPAECVVTGALEKIENLSFITTEPIPINGLTKTLRQKVRLKESPDYTISDEQDFYVVIPIVKKRAK